MGVVDDIDGNGQVTTANSLPYNQVVAEDDTRTSASISFEALGATPWTLARLLPLAWV